MASQENNTHIAGKGPQNTPVEQLQQQDGRDDQSAAQPTADQQAQGHDYVVDSQIAEMEAGNMPPTIAQDPAAPGVNDLSMGGTAWLAQTDQVLQIYTRPGSSSTVGQVEPNAQVSVVEGPQQHGDGQWLRVRTAEGQEGWVRSEDLRSE